MVSKTHVLLLQTSLFPSVFKCIVTNVDASDVIKVHSQVYIDQTFKLLEKHAIYDSLLFSVFLDKIPHIKSGFVTVSFDEDYTTTSDDLPNHFFTLDKIDIVNNLITYINKLYAIVNVITLDDEQDESKNLFIDKNEELFAVASPTNSQSKTTEVYHIDNTSSNVCDNVYNKYIIFNNGYLYNFNLIKEIFPEFLITKYKNFPVTTIAFDMFWFQINKNEHILQVVSTIIKFFETSKVIGEKVEKDNFHLEQYKVVKKFLDERCINIPGSKTNSTVLFNAFITFAKEISRDFDMTHTYFSTLIKRLSSYTSKRTGTGMVWMDLELLLNAK